MVKKILATALAGTMVLGASISGLAAPVANFGDATPADSLEATGIYKDSVGSVVEDKDAVTIDDVVGRDETQGKHTQYIESEEITDTAFDEELSEVEVYATVAPSFTLKIPKTIVLSSEGEAEFAVEAKGDITGNQTINVVPDDSFMMSEMIPGTATKVDAASAKDDIEATVTMADTAWTYIDDFKAAADADTYVAHEGSISAPDISAGSWAGVFNFTISLDNATA